MFYWFLKLFVVGPIAKVLFRPWAEGVENVPKTGPAVLASNHLSLADTVFLPLAVDRKITFLAKSDYFTGRGLKGRLTAGFFRGVGQVPLDRTGGRSSDPALRSSLQVLAEGELVGIYPEGTRSPDGRLYRGRTGVARLALEGKVPVIPVAMIETDRIVPPGRLRPRLARPGVRFGEPLDFSRYEGMEGDRLVLRSITDELMYKLAELSGQEYVDEYASTVKRRLAEQGENGERDEAEPRGDEPGEGDRPEEPGTAG